MYNPYLEEEEFLPVEAATLLPDGEMPNPLAALSPSLKNLAGDIVSKMGGFSAISQLFAKKEKPLSSMVEGEGTEPMGGFLEGLKQRFHLEDLESGDILLVIIVIYLMLEGDDKLELAITMGILALMWYLDHKSKEEA